MDNLNGNIDKNFKWQLYNSDLKTNVEIPNLIDLLDTNFCIICEKISNVNELSPQKYAINNAVHISQNNKIIEKVLTDTNLNKYTYYKMEMGILLEDILANQYSSIVIYGLPLKDGKFQNQYFVIDKQTVLQYADLIKIYNALKSIKFGHYSKEEYYEKIKNYDMYFIGNKTLMDAPIDENGNFILKTGDIVYVTDENNNKASLFLSEISYKTKDGLENKALKVFTSYDSAATFGGNEATICKMPLWKIKEKYNGPIIIEPHRNWWVEF